MREKERGENEREIKRKKGKEKRGKGVSRDLDTQEKREKESQGLFTPVSLGYPLSVFNKNSTLKEKEREEKECIPLDLIVKCNVFLKNKSP